MYRRQYFEGQLTGPHTGYALSNIHNRIIDLIQYEIILFYLYMLTDKK